MKITFVHVSSLLNLRGSERWLLDACGLFRASQDAVQVITFDRDQQYAKGGEVARRSKIVSEALGDVRLVHLRATKLKLPAPIRSLSKAFTKSVDMNAGFIPLNRKFLRVLRESDVVYFLQTSQRPTALITVLACCCLAGRKPVIAGIHARPNVGPFQTGLLRLFSRMGVLRGIHTINKADERTMKRLIQCPTKYIPNGTFVPASIEPDERRLSQKEFVVLYVGAMTRAKGADILPEIFEGIKERGLSFRYIICSSGGRFDENFRKWSEGKESVEVRGFVGRAELDENYKEASVILLPSRREAFGIACIEAQSFGTPVVASNAEGFHVSVMDGLTGFLVREYNPESFVDQLERVYNMWKYDRDSYVMMSRRAADFVRERFRWEVVSVELRSFIMRSLHDSGGR